MLNKSKMVGSLAGLGFFLALTPNITLAEAVRPCCFASSQGTRTKMDMSASAEKQTNQFQKIEQPIGLKLAVALGGLGLIGAELWWFMFSNANSQHLKPSSSDRVSKTKSQKAQVKQGIREVDIVVDGGYTPDRIEVTAGEPVKLNFYRQDASSCSEQVLLPDFDKALDLTLNQTTSVEIVPERAGEYNFTCGMNMYRGTIIAN